MVKTKSKFQYKSRKKLLYIAIPISVQQFLLAAVGAGDSLMLGFVNADSMAAVSLAANIEFIENLFLSAFIGGATILAAQYWGKSDKNTIERIFGLVMRYSIVISVITTTIAFFHPNQLMKLFTNEDTLITIGSEYIQMAVPSYLVTGVSQCYLCIMKTSEKTKQSVFITTFALSLDTLLNIIFILCFNMGAKGAALTTSITRVIELIIVLLYSRKATVKPKFLSKTTRILHRDFLKCSIPHLINCILWGLGTSVYTSVIGHLGTAITTAYSATSVVRNLAASISRGLSQGTEIVLGNILGSGELEEGRIFAKTLSRFSIICGCLCSLIALICGFVLSNFMSLSNDAQSNFKIMILISAFYVISQCINIVIVCGIFTAGGDTAFDAYSLGATMWLIIIPLALISAFILKLPPITVYFIISLDEIIKVPWVYIHYRKYKWLNNITREEY